MKKSKTAQQMTLRTKLNLLVLLDILIVIILIMTSFSLLFIRKQFDEMGQRALDEAETVAAMPEIREAFQTPNPSVIIQPLAGMIRKQTGAEFVVVTNMELTRYSHPDPEYIGKRLSADSDNDNQIVLQGRPSITQAVGSLGLSVRGKAPIFADNHRQIGIVSVGFLVKKIWKNIEDYLVVFAGLGVVGLAIGFLGAYLLSGHMKKQIFNMEPYEIALLTQEQGAILESIREGVLAIDINEKITACNQEAKRLLELEKTDLIVGKSVTEMIPNSRLPEVLRDGQSHLDQPMIVGNTLIITNRIPVMLKDKVIGAVATFRDKMQLDEIDQRLTDVGRYVETIRSQRHEFMNRLHTISGLIKVEEYGLARQLIDQVNHEQQSVLEFFLAHIRDPAVVGILIGKLHRANELGIKFQIDTHSYILDPCPHREVVITFLGNAIENSFEALTDWNSKTRSPDVTVYINNENGQMILRVSDSGPGIAHELIEKVFEDGVSSKGFGRGFGLALVSRRITNLGGRLTIKSPDEGTIIEAVLPV